VIEEHIDRDWIAKSRIKEHKNWKELYPWTNSAIEETGETFLKWWGETGEANTQIIETWNKKVTQEKNNKIITRWWEQHKQVWYTAGSTNKWELLRCAYKQRKLTPQLGQKIAVFN
jgi:hypothetical protein